MERPGGYIRILRLGHRRGDGGAIAQIELRRQRVRSEEGGGRKGRTGSRRARAPKQKSVGERLRAAAQSLRGKKDAKAQKGDASHAKPTRPAKGGKKTTTPRKAGGS